MCYPGPAICLGAVFLRSRDWPIRTGRRRRETERFWLRLAVLRDSPCVWPWWERCVMCLFVIRDARFQRFASRWREANNFFSNKKLIFYELKDSFTWIFSNKLNWTEMGIGTRLGLVLVVQCTICGKNITHTKVSQGASLTQFARRCTGQEV